MKKYVANDSTLALFDDFIYTCKLTYLPFCLEWNTRPKFCLPHSKLENFSQENRWDCWFPPPESHMFGLQEVLTHPDGEEPSHKASPPLFLFSPQFLEELYRNSALHYIPRRFYLPGGWQKMRVSTYINIFKLMLARAL